MAIDSLAIRFTDDKYCTRLEVAKILGTNLIDPLWNDILKYRETFKQVTILKDVSRSSFFFINTNKIIEKTNNIENLLTKFKNEYENMLGGNMSKSIFKKEMFKTSLRVIAVNNNIEYSDISLDKIVNGKPFEMSHLLLSKYLSILDKITDYDPFNEELLANYYQFLRNESELTSFYRLTDIISESSQYLVSKEYDGIPSKEIEPLMAILLDYLNNSNDSKLHKIIATIFMFNYIKPFEVYNDEMCMLLVNKILGHRECFIPIEIIFRNLNLLQLNKEIQRTKDLTYLLVSCVDSIEKAIFIALDKIVQTNGRDVEQTYLAGDDIEEFKKEFHVDPEKNVIGPKIEIEESKQSIEDIKKEEPTNLIKTPNPKYLMDKELKEKANKLLEDDPYLRKNQAHFYVRHCEKGKYYTIQQFKKEERCVYETARTSMDNLAKLGYYRREQIKNKFVYTPIEK